MKATQCIAGAVCAFTLSLSPPVQGQTQTLVIPYLGKASTANSSSPHPWDQKSTSTRVQHIYDSFAFTLPATPVKGRILISRLRWRADDTAPTNKAWTGGTFGGVTIKMSTAAVDYKALTTTFSANHGPDVTTVFSGPVTVAAGKGTGSGVPGPYYVDVTLNSPFLYDPTQDKDLLIDIASDGSAWTPATGTTIPLAAASGTGYLSRSLYNLNSHTATTGSIQADIGVIMEVTYGPPVGLFAGFTASPIQGGQNLKVTFQDTSFTSDSGGIQSWAWDFDGDSKVDSTAQNPTYTYTCGTLSPNLAVTDKVRQPSTRRRKDLINAGVVKADFAASPASGLAPLKVTFTDKSTGGPTAWQWDFDNDGNVDSTEQNPTYTYTNNGSFDVKLTAVGPCNKDSLTIEHFVSVGEACITTLFVSNNGLSSSGSGNLFDVDVKNPKGLKITSFAVNSYAAATSAITLDVYVTPNTYVGADSNSSTWVKVATGSGPAQGQDVPTPIDTSDFFLPAGKYGMYLIHTSASGSPGPRYTDGTGSNQNYSNADIALTMGISRTTPWGGTVNSPRVWNGSICYTAVDQAASGAYGFGCPGSGGKSPRLSLSADPVVGKTVNIDIADMVNVATGPGLLFVGLQRTQVDLTGIGMSGCFLFNDALIILGFTNTQGTASLPVSIPDSSDTVGVQVFLQAANSDTGSNGGIAASHGLAIRAGR